MISPLHWRTTAEWEQRHDHSNWDFSHVATIANDRPNFNRRRWQKDEIRSDALQRERRGVHSDRDNCELMVGSE